MKKAIALAVLLMAASQVLAQVNITRTAGTGYILQTTAGDTLHLRGATPVYNSYHTAYMDALNWSGERGGEVVHVITTITDRVSADFGWYDEPDIIYVPEEKPLVRNLSVALGGPQDEPEIITSAIVDSDKVQGVRIVHDCPEERVITTFPANDILYHTTGTTCTDTLNVMVEITGANEVVSEYFTISEFWLPDIADGEMFYTQFEHGADDWAPLWGTINHGIADNMLAIELPERNIARVQWLPVPEHRNVNVQWTEVVDSSHATGVHLSMRTSQEQRGHSVETYLHGHGIGVSIFSDGQWTNPVSFPFDWEFNRPIKQVVSLAGDSLRVMAWHADEEKPAEWHVYRSDVIGNIPAGVFSIGSTGAGWYYIDRINVWIQD